MPDPAQGIAGSSAPYRGADRRGAIVGDESPQLVPVLIGGLVIVVAFVLTSLGASRPGIWSAIDGQALTAMLSAAGVAVGVAASALLVQRWRMVGDSAALWCAAGMATLAVGGVAVAQLLPMVVVEGIDVDTVHVIRPAALLVSMTTFAVALRAPQVDARLRPVHVIAGALVATIVAGAVILRVPWLVVTAGVGFPSYALSLLVGTAWITLSTIYFLRGARTNRPMLRWFGLMLYGLTMAEVSGAMGAQTEQGAWDTGASLMTVAALTFGAIGAARELQVSFRAKDSRLLTTAQLRHLDAEQLRRAEEAQAERAHEARNALAAIDGATKTLERHRDRLDEKQRDALTLAITDEIARIQQLVSMRATPAFRMAFHIDEVVGAQIALTRSQGLRVLADLDTSLVAMGRPADLAEVLQNLLVNAQRHADVTTVAVRTRRHGDRVLVRVEDRGPGVPAVLRQRIFERGVTSGLDGSSGLGLHVSARLMREQDGELWVEDREGGGAAFVAALPIAPSSADPADPKPVLETREVVEAEGRTVDVVDDDGASAV